MGATWALRGYIFIDKFSVPWRYVSHFLHKLVIMHSLLFQTFIKMCQSALWMFGGLDHPL